MQVHLHSDKSSKSNIAIIIGAAAGGSVLAILLLLAGVYAFRQKRRAEKTTEQSSRPFGNTIFSSCELYFVIAFFFLTDNSM